MRVVRWGRIGLALAATASFAQPPAADGAGNRMVPLPAVDRVTAEQAQARSALHCTAERDFCLRAWRESANGSWTLDIHHRVPAGANVAPARRIALPRDEHPGSGEHSIWPHLVREASGALLIGVERYRRTGFSGGGAGETELVLLRLETPAAEPAELLTLRTGYTAMIRACFSEADYRSGRPCHQELAFSGRVTLAPSAVGGRSALAVATTARVFPRGSLQEGWETRPYRRANSVWETDPACSYRRLFAFNAASGRYEPDRPLPDCSTYSLP